ncbi:MAG: hypothetical protein H7145_21715 [Akkermansiaceae bacterium]|nr:hypothetical protein [Armatimonadota bacterium]
MPEFRSRTLRPNISDGDPNRLAAFRAPFTLSMTAARAETVGDGDTTGDGEMTGDGDGEGDPEGEGESLPPPHPAKNKILATTEVVIYGARWANTGIKWFMIFPPSSARKDLWRKALYQRIHLYP